MMKRILFNLLVLLSVAGCKPKEVAVTSRPNIIVIITDDHAKNAVSAYGSKLINTPNIDRIGKEGITFNKAFVTNSLCGPSRAVILTGRYSHLNGFRDNNDSFDNKQVTYPQLLRDAGYFTSVIGKWHLGTEPKGFDYWKILIDQGQYYNPDFVENGDTVRHEGYVTNLITDFSLAVLDKRPADKPFCLLLQQKAPHRNWLPDFKHMALFDNDTLPLPATFYDDYTTRSAAASEQDMEIRNMFLSYDMKLNLPEGMKDTGTGGHHGADGKKMWAGDYNRFTDEQKKLWDEYYKPISDVFFKKTLKGKELEEWMYQRYLKDYLRCVVSVDENIGRLLTYLEEKKMLDNTLIVYTSDQGFFLGEHGWYDKRFMYEESLGTPLMIRFPLKVPSGLVSDNLVLNLDLAPTLLEAAGVEVPSDMQGNSLLPLMTKTPAKEWRSGIYYHYFEFPHGAHKVKKHYGIRTDRYKLIHFYNDIDEWELFDLQADPNEVNNLYGQKEFVPLTDSLKKELYKLKEQFRDTTRVQTRR